MNKQQDKFMTELTRLLESQNFQSEEEMEKFLNDLMGKDISSFKNKPSTNKEKAQDLVYEAYDLTPAIAKKKIEKALQLDPDCIEAYEYLGDTEESIQKADAFYEKGIEIGRRLFCGEKYNEYKGYFWGIVETRPFMRCLRDHAEILYLLGKKKECVEIFEEMIEFNPNDNQGVRDQLMLYLIELNEDSKYEKYFKMFKNEDKAFSLFNYALYTFKKEGDTLKSKKQLQKALKQNKYVAKKILSAISIVELAEYYGIGDENEADYYVSYAQPIWWETKGAIDWLRKYSTMS